MLKDYITTMEIKMDIIKAEEVKSLRKEMGYKNAKETIKVIGIWRCNDG